MSGPERGEAPASRRLAVVAVLTAMAAVVLDAGIANVALLTLAERLGTTPAQAVAVISAYQAGLVMALLPCGALGERFGHRPIFVAGLMVFGAAAILGARAPSLPYLIAARLLQGLGGAAVMALGVALLRFSVAPGQLGAAIGWNALTVALASAMAPSVGAAILSAAGWRWTFVASVPLTAAAMAAFGALPDTPRRPAPLDAVSMAMNAGVFALLVLSAQFATASPGPALVLFAGALLVSRLLLGREAPKAQPMIPLDLLGDRTFRLAVLASLCGFAGQAAGLVALPFHLQHGFHQTALATGLYVTAWPASVAMTAVGAGWLADRVSTAGLCAAGAACLAAGLAGAATVPVSSAPLSLVPAIALCGVGFGLFQSPNNRTMFLAAPPDRSGAAGGMQGTARVSGQTVGALTATLLFTLAPPAVAPRMCLALGAGFALIASLASLSRRAGPRAAAGQPRRAA